MATKKTVAPEPENLADGVYLLVVKAGKYRLGELAPVLVNFVESLAGARKKVTKKR